MTLFSDRLAQWRGVRCERVLGVKYEAPSIELIFAVGTVIEFSDGTRLSAQFWRLTKKGRPEVSIFDHRRQYGLPAPIDALSVLRGELVGGQLLAAEMDQTTAGLRFMFDNDRRLEVFNFTGFEIWEFTFPGNTGQLSNYALED